MGSVVSIKFCKAKKLSEQGDALNSLFLALCIWDIRASKM